MPNPDFVGLVQSVLGAAEAAMGEFSPVQASVARDGIKTRATVERSYRLLSMLAEKTRGNLDRTESELLGGALATLREYLSTLEA
ncbi:hypothetical protein HNR42_001363 [Deinobacterium chartae]|uniref:DUF1844 domain-containing protein n=1 Tax=Deinobacterium chartae TaxID=521158 RepID=A0A841I0H0_9DEIO|nr:DUF1844 domain-containing protein [Deinobacterium chartae]MBB6097940.1 hypothetical protein [Deinobacterium chartae]